MNTNSKKISPWSIAAGLFILLAAIFLRFHELSDRPLHFDESTNARMLGTQLEKDAQPFDPKHFHGPLLNQITAPYAQVSGETSWKTLTKHTLRIPTAVFSLLMVIIALGLSRFGQREDGLAAGLLLATSPLLVYYGRMYIHETLFITCGLFTLFTLLLFLNRPTRKASIYFGLGLGLMAATRETWVISLFAWGISSILYLAISRGKACPILFLKKQVYRFTKPLVLAGVIAAIVILISYSSLGKHPSGIIDFFRTYWVYSPVEGHEKPFLYYMDMLVFPKHQDGLWWTEVGVLFFALIALLKTPKGGHRKTAIFIFTAGMLHLLVYSCIAYKTPWLVGLGWAHLCLCAGIGATTLIRSQNKPSKIIATALFALVITWQAQQAHRAAFRFSSDARNPYTYVHTTKDAERMAKWLEKLAKQHPEIKSTPVAVIGAFYWPLPWYLRSFDAVGYWSQLPNNANSLPLLLIMPQSDETVSDTLKKTHLFFPRGLRHEVPVTVAIRKDLWDTE